MAQHDYNLANQSGADFRADLNNALSAIVTVNSGATAPSTTFAHQLWVDTSSNVLKIRNAANDAWVTTGLSITADNTFAGNLTGNVTGNLIGDVTGNADTATALETARTINGASFDGTANISFGTDSVSEGSSNLYFTNARVESYLDAGTSTPTFASAVINTSITGSAILDDDSFGTASATTVATSESIKAYVDSQVGSVDTLAEILLNGNTTGGTDIAFGDNDKAIFGTGSDLQIYSDGATGIIQQVGAGVLLLKGQDFYIQNDAGENFLRAETDGAVRLYYDNAGKLDTTSTGIDVTGTVTSDGLTSEGTSGTWAIQDNGYIQTFSRAGANYIRASDASGILRFDTGGTTIRQKIASNGDISFYDDTGTTQGLFWDASAEKLGLGTTSPSAPLSIGGTGSLGAISNNYKIATSIDGGFSTTNARQHKVIGFIGTTAGGVDIYDSSYASGETSKNFYSGLFTDNSYFNASSYRIVQGGKSRLTIKQDGEFVINDDSLDRDFRVESDNNTHALFVQGSDSKVGIGTSSPTGLLSLQKGTRNLDFKLESTPASGDAGVQITAGAGDYLGLYAGSSNGELLLGSNGQERARINSSGNVGIGTSSPSNTLEVKSSGNDNGILLKGSGGDNIAWIHQQSTDAATLRLYDGGSLKVLIGSNTNSDSYFNTGGNFGIGTASPSAKLHLNTSDTTATYRIQGATSAAIDFYNSTTKNGALLVNSSNFLVAADNSNPIAFNTGGSETARFDINGNLLIGTTAADIVGSATATGINLNPNSASSFNRSGGAPLFVNRIGSDGNLLQFRKSGSTVGSIGSYVSLLYLGKGDTTLLFDDANNHIVPRGTNGGARDGAINLGSSGNRFKDLHLSGQAYASYFRPTPSSADFINFSSGNIRFATGSSEKARIDSSGNLLVGTTSTTPSTGGNSITGGSTGYMVTSHADGTASGNWYHAFRYNTNTIGSITQIGTTAVAYNTTSDARLKDVTGEARGLEVITKLNPVAYNWKADGKADEGLIAQEVKELVPNAVTGSEDEHYQMDYSKLVTHLVKAVQELEQQTIELKKEIANLKGE